MKTPSCIQKYASKASLELRTKVKSEIETSDIFGLVCTCGNDFFTISGNQIEGYNGLGDPVYIKCDKCSNEFLVFDSCKHGYDGVLGNTTRGENELIQNKHLVCTNCKNEKFNLAFGFEHSINKDEAKEIIAEENLKIGREDLFTWIIGFGKCKECQKIIEVANVECA